jgi:cytoplasmic iron level regulating protein YaaA (DUF328/UPF0246 family)
MPPAARHHPFSLEWRAIIGAIDPGMLAIISPAKRLDFETQVRLPTHTQPAFLDRSGELIAALRKKTPAGLTRLMGISAKLADLNAERYADWHTPFTPANAKPAALAFMGDVYLGLDATSLDARALGWAQKHLRILSGLYGVLRPLDLIQPYRLEMGTALATKRGKDLYAFWGDSITAALNETLRATKPTVLINLASNEYYGAVRSDRIEGRIVTPQFIEKKNGRYMFVSFTAKRARGLMARYMIDHRVTTLKGLKGFDVEDYVYCEERSVGDHWVFRRG